MLARLHRWLRRSEPAVYVRLQFTDGALVLGPMDRFTAEVYLAHRLASDPTYLKRRVLSARIVA